MDPAEADRLGIGAALAAYNRGHPVVGSRGSYGVAAAGHEELTRASQEDRGALPSASSISSPICDWTASCGRRVSKS
jgi:hypothetical protein